MADVNARLLIDGYDAECIPVDELEAEFKDDEANERVVNISPELGEFIHRTNESHFAKRVAETIDSLPGDQDFLKYPVSTPQNVHLFWRLFKKIAGTCGIEFKKGMVYDYGGDRKVSTDDACDFEKSIPAIVEEFKGEAFIGALSKNSYLIMVQDGIFNLCLFGCSCIYDLANTDIVYRVLKNVSFKNLGEQCKMVDYVVYDRNFHTTSLRVQKQDCDVTLNYNDDLPDERIEKWINSTESGLMVLHGEPGTGKTSYIRNLIYRTNNRFMFFDKSLFQHMSDASLIDMLLEHRNSVIVLEDCEDLLTDRTGLGSCLATILNLTDGILGDSLKFKFICTFNANVVDIDPAILRKGRMHLKYEFGKLNADKAVKLGEKLGVEVPHKDMALCEVYNYTTDNGKPQEKAKVGF